MLDRSSPHCLKCPHDTQSSTQLMESAAAARFFRQVFEYNHLSRCSSKSTFRCRASANGFVSRRYAGSYSNMRKRTEQHDSGQLIQTKETKDKLWKPRKDLKLADRQKEFEEYELVTADQLRSKDRRPRRVKMYMRDFIEDSLYNPHYGYFSSQAVIFDPGEPFNFSGLRDEAQFNTLLSERYTSFEDQLDAVEPNNIRQLWHTPTELFRPHYAEAMARFLVENYRLTLYPYNDLIIYELGAGNGTFMVNVLDYIRDTAPEVYARTRYKIIEISAALAELQRRKLAAAGHSQDKVEIINKSIFAWNTPAPAPCFVVALEVIDNFGHDAVRYDRRSGRAHQSTVLVDTAGDFYEFWTPHLDPVAARFQHVRAAACADRIRYRTPANPSPLKARWGALRTPPTAGLPPPNLSEPEYIPTRLLDFFDVLARYFPAHRLLLSDFDALPDAAPGLNAPVVQTRFERRTIPVSTPLVRQGFFDIFFPTDFEVMEAVYRAVTGRLTRCVTHEEFMARWAFVEETRTRSGENPLLSWYKNAKVLTTV